MRLPEPKSISRTLHRRVLLSGAALACIALTAAGLSRGSDEQAPPLQRGVALGLFSEDPDWSYAGMLDEIKSVGATHVAITVPWYVKTVRDTKIYKHPRFTVPMRTVRRAIEDAYKRGFAVFLFPILRVEDGSDGGWRGVLAPSDPEAFYRSYFDFIVGFAEIAQEMKVSLFSVGSELSSLDVDEKRWREVIRRVREVYKGKLTYSANWDHYEKVAFFDALDYAGVTGYFEIAEVKTDPTIEDLIHSWRNVYHRLMRWLYRVNKPLILTEVGYLSQKDAAATPWREGADEALDLDIQRRCYEAFRRVWNGEPRLFGVYFWNWFGWGGADSKEYTPRNKPAAGEVKRWYLKPDGVKP